MSDQPLITFALISYNDEKYIEQAVEGAFAQTYQPLEIILSNDCSTDGTFEIMERMAARYRGPHKLILNRNEQNLGTGGHVNRIMQISRGEIIVIAAGDDISLKNRTENLYKIFKQGQGRIKSVYSNSMLIDETGRGEHFQFNEPANSDDLLLANIVRGYEFGIVAGSSHAWTRDLFETFGPLLTPLSVEDSPIAFRAALLGQIVYSPEVLVKHRRHRNNTWQYTVRDPVKDIRYQTFEGEAVMRNWLHDIDALLGLAPEKTKELDAYRQVLSKRIARIQDDIRLFQSSWFRRAAIISSDIMNGTRFRTIRHKIGLFLTPAVYNRYVLIKKRAGAERVH